jgi:hypothetical protein
MKKIRRNTIECKGRSQKTLLTSLIFFFNSKSEKRRYSRQPITKYEQHINIDYEKGTVRYPLVPTVGKKNILPITKFGFDEMKLEMLDEVDPDLGGEVAGGAAHQLPVDLRLQRHLLPFTRLEGVLQSDRGHSVTFLHGSGS